MLFGHFDMYHCSLDYVDECRVFMASQILVHLGSQQDLEDAISLVDRNERIRSLRLRLRKEHDTLPPGKLGELFGDKSTVGSYILLVNWFICWLVD